MWGAICGPQKRCPVANRVLIGKRYGKRSLIRGAVFIGQSRLLTPGDMSVLQWLHTRPRFRAGFGPACSFMLLEDEVYFFELTVM